MAQRDGSWRTELPRPSEANPNEHLKSPSCINCAVEFTFPCGKKRCHMPIATMILAAFAFLSISATVSKAQFSPFDRGGSSIDRLIQDNQRDVARTPPGALGESVDPNWIEQHVSWCFSSAADQTITEQATPFPRAMCKSILAGGLISGLGGILGNNIQSQWAADARRLSCSPDPNSQMLAVGLIAACQCHHDNLANDIMFRYRASVIVSLRRRAGCAHLGLPIF